MSSRGLKLSVDNEKRGHQATSSSLNDLILNELQTVGRSEGLKGFEIVYAGTVNTFQFVYNKILLYLILQ